MAQLPGSGVDGGGIHPFYANTLRRDTVNNFADRYHWGNRNAYVERFNTNSSLSYVTGSHNLKVGIMNSWGPFRLIEQENGALRQRYRDAIPYQIGRTNHPIDYSLGYQDIAMYVQDTWTIDRLTLNLGLRWETVNGTVDPTNRLLHTRWTVPTTLPGKQNIPDWTDIAPRIGLAYDLFGDASTALKFSWGRYNASVTHSLADRLHTGKAQRQSLAWFDCAMITVRHGSASNRCATMAELDAISPGLGAVAYGNSGLTDWGDAKVAGSVPNHGTNGDDYVQDWEVGLASADFGQGTSTPILDPNGLDRPWVGLTNIGIERELWPGLSASFNYYRRDSYGALIEVNRALSVADFTQFQLANPCASNPTPGPGGFGCTTNGASIPATLPVYVLKPEAQGRTRERVYTNTNADTGYSETYNGFESGFNARLPNGTTLFGAYTFERNIMTRCDSPDNPNRWLFCDRSGQHALSGQDVGPSYDMPWLHEFKLSGTVPLPGDFQFSATLQSYTPRELLATTSFSGDSASGLNGGGGLWGGLLALGNVGYSVKKAEIEAAGVPFTSSPFIPLMAPGSTYLDRLNQFDISFRKVFQLAGGPAPQRPGRRLQPAQRRSDPSRRSTATAAASAGRAGPSRAGSCSSRRTSTGRGFVRPRSRVTHARPVDFAGREAMLLPGPLSFAAPPGRRRACRPAGKRRRSQSVPTRRESAPWKSYPARATLPGRTNPKSRIGLLGFAPGARRVTDRRPT